MMTVSEIKQEISLLNSPNELPISKAQQQELDKRYKDYQAGNVTLHHWQTVHEQLRAKYQ